MTYQVGKEYKYDGQIVKLMKIYDENKKSIKAHIQYKFGKRAVVDIVELKEI
jgi:hypothetical protein